MKKNLSRKLTKFIRKCRFNPAIGRDPDSERIISPADPILTVKKQKFYISTTPIRCSSSPQYLAYDMLGSEIVRLWYSVCGMPDNTFFSSSFFGGVHN